MSNSKLSSTVDYTFMNSDFEINSIESHNMQWNSHVAGGHACSLQGFSV